MVDTVAMSHYTQLDGTPEGLTYFQDIAITPANVASGAIRARFDPIAYPAVGEQAAKGSATVTLAASSVTPVHATSVTLTATAHPVSPTTDVPTGTVTFKDGATSLGTATPNGSGIATLVVAGGFTTGAHSLTAVLAADANVTTATSTTLVVTAS